MTYRDVMMVTYPRLKRIMDTDKPFRDTQAYPLGERRYSSRHFRQREDGAFTLHNYHLINAEKDLKTGEKNGYYTLAVVHPDNSFEYKYMGYGGDIQIYKSLTGGAGHVKARGGHIHYYKKMHPLFRGLRIDLDTHEAVTPYVLRTKTLDKKKAKEYLRQFEVPKKVGRHMLEAMDPKGRTEVCADIVKEYGADSLTHDHVTKLFKEGKYADAVACGVMIDSNWHMIRAADNCNKHGDSKWPFHYERIFGEEFEEELASALKGPLDTSILRGEPEVFKYSDAHKMGDVFPASKWGYSLQDLDGNNLVRM
jgi:hypothetical protein